MAPKAINVKISTKKVIEALEKALKKRVDEKKASEKAEETYQKDMKAFHEKLVAMFREGKGNVVMVSDVGSWRDDANTWNIQVQFPVSAKAPKRPDTTYTSNRYTINTEIEEIENAIAILKMTDEEYVSTNTYKGVAQYIK